VQARFGRLCCRETIRAALHRLGLSWQKAKKLLGRAHPGRRAAFIEQVRPLLDGAGRDRHQLVYWDEAHIHQDVDLGHGWGERGKRFFVASSSPGLSAKVSFSGKPLGLTYGLYLYNEGQVRIWPYPRANGEHTIDVLHRLRAELPDGKLIVVWDGAPYHRAKAVWAEAASLGIELAPLPGYSRVDVDLAEAVPVLVAGILAAGVADRFVPIASGGQAGVDAIFVRVDEGARGDSGGDDRLDRGLLHIGQHAQHHLSAALDQAKDRRLVLLQRAASRRACQLAAPSEPPLLATAAGWPLCPATT